MSVYTNVFSVQDEVEPLFLSGTSRPVCQFKSLQAYTFPSDQALKWDVIFCVERHPPANSALITNGGNFSILNNPFTTKVVSFQREEQGAYLLNNTLNALNYNVSGSTGMKTINAKAAQRRID